MRKQALLSVSDKTGIVDFARELVAAGYHILSTGGTAKLLAKEGIEVQEVADYTGFPEMLDGRVKTLNPKIHAGILARRPDPAHMAALAEHDIDPIDIVVVNLYPFEQTIAKPDCTFEDAIENIDIGGPTMIRAAAKNHESVAVVVDPADYGRVAEELRSTGAVSAETRFALAKKVFAHTARYDAMITNYLTSLDAERKPQRFRPFLLGSGKKFRIFATARIRIRPLRSIAKSMSRLACLPATSSSRAKNFPTTILLTVMRHGNALAPSRSRAASSSSMPIPAALRSASMQRKLTGKPSKPTANPLSAASSPSTAS